jgi:hypothetical protein
LGHLAPVAGYPALGVNPGKNALAEASQNEYVGLDLIEIIGVIAGIKEFHPPFVRLA